MDPELTKRLVERFPVLYQDYFSPASESAMCWGFDHGDGWFLILWQLSLAIEEELGYSWRKQRWLLAKKRLFRLWNHLLYALSPIGQEKKRLEGAGTTEEPFRWVVAEPARPDWLARRAMRFFSPRTLEDQSSWPSRFSRLGFKLLVRSTGTGFAVWQVKEKYGTLRYDCPGEAALQRYVRLAERLSAITCEECGEPGSPGGSDWIRTLCPHCRRGRAAGPATPASSFRSNPPLE